MHLCKLQQPVKLLKAGAEASKVVDFIVHEGKTTSLLPVLNIKSGFGFQRAG